MERSLTGIAPRQLAAVLTRRLTEEPAIVLNGPRTVGKSTLLHALADQSDLAGIRALRARIGGRLATAVVLYTGALTFRFEDGTLVLPLDALWSKA